MESLCPDCDTVFGPSDNYCRECGMYLAATRALAVSREPQLPAVRERVSVPAPVVKAATAVAAGAALQLGISLAGKYLAGQAARTAGRAVVAAPKARGRKRRKEAEVVEARPAEPVMDTMAVSETLVIRRTFIRRG